MTRRMSTYDDQKIVDNKKLYSKQFIDVVEIVQCFALRIFNV